MNLAQLAALLALRSRQTKSPYPLASELKAALKATPPTVVVGDTPDGPKISGVPIVTLTAAELLALYPTLPLKIKRGPGGLQARADAQAPCEGQGGKMTRERTLDCAERQRKTLDDYFTDWEAHVFGYGYGSGEPFIVPALRCFMMVAPQAGGTYDHRELESALSPTVAWLLINTLCRADIIEYGTSPRFGWLTNKGERLKAFIWSKTDDELLALCSCEQEYIHCMPDVCNCGPHGYEKSRVCQNPFWLDIR